jgi:hypothetical protein
LQRDLQLFNYLRLLAKLWLNIQQQKKEEVCSILVPKAFCHIYYERQKKKNSVRKKENSLERKDIKEKKRKRKEKKEERKNEKTRKQANQSKKFKNIQH